MSISINCILFDLDGTLLDTSYDFAYALNQTCRAFNVPSLRYQDLRKVVSQGGLAMTKLAFPDMEGEPLETRKQYFLNTYFENIDHHTQIFPGLETGLQTLAEKNIPWGIVTNKPTWLTEKLLQNIHFPTSPKAVVCGDTLQVNKPDPAPLQLAAEQCKTPSQNCLYIGDHLRDIEAGNRAGMQTAAAMFGYILDAPNAPKWPAHHFFETPYEISQYFKAL